MTDTISEAPTPELFKGDNEKDVGIPPRSASIVSKSSKKKRNKRKRARQWTYYIDTLKGTIDCLYEMCRSEHSVAGCREAVLYLQNASNDFKALIDTINVEVEWNQTSLKKQSVAWEIRKSMSSPNPHAINDKLAGTSTSLLPISMLAEAVRNANAIESGSMSDSSNFGPSPSTKISYAQITAAAESFIVAAVAAEQQHYQNQLEDGWQVVRGRRRKSASSTTVSEYDREMSLESDQTPIAPLNVYERLSSRIGSAVCRRGNYSNSSTSQRSSRAENSLSSAPSNSRLTCPRSAMDLPQTKASMAKMAYSRQLLWERSQQLLVEKLRARQKKDKLALSHPPHAAIASSGVASSAVAGAVSETTSTASRPARPSTCGFTFADPLAVRKSVEEYTQQKRKRMQQQQQKMISTSSEHVDHSLQSINEDASETIATADMTVSVVSEDAVPADPKPMSPVQKDKEPTPPGRNSRSEPMTTSQTLLAAKPAGSSTSAPPSVDVDDDVSALVEDDVVWREMTEEEESLALEENSLKFEIEKAESISIDAELEQQVTVEADQLERAERKEKRRSQRAKDEESKAASSSQDYQKFYQAFRAELHTLATVAWSELMSHQMPLGPVHEPGTPVERHEKMNSPSRRKCEKDDDDFGRRHEEKLRRADELRLQLQEERATRVKELTHRVEEVRAKQAAIKERKRQLLEHRMQRAIENRETHITEIIRKAKDDDQKVLEIQFINTLQEEGKRHDLMVKDACMEEKRKQMADGRARKLEEKATKEAAAVSRRRQAEIARHSRLQEMADRKEARSLQRASEQEEKKRIQKDKMTTPMKVASCASTPTQKEKEQKHADEAAEEFKADVAKADESTEAAEEEPVDVWRRFVERRRVLLDLEDKWTKVDDAKFWPSDDALKTARACKKCDEKMQSELQVMAHIVSDKHLEGADLLKTKCESQDLRNEEMSMIDTDELVVAAVADDVDVDKEDRLSQVVGRIIDLQSRDSVPTTVTMSPRTRLRQVNGLTSLLDKAAVMKTIDDGIQKSLETTLCELVAGYDEEERKGTTMFADQLVASGGIQKTCNALLEWIQRGASLRLCLRYAHLLCTFLPNPRVAYTILYKPQLQRMLETIVRLVATSPTSPQLAALLDVVKALLTSVSSRIVAPNAKEAKRWKELKPLDEGASEAMSAVAEYLRCSLSATTILGAIKAVGVGGIALTMRLHGVLLAMSPCDLGEKLYIEFMDAVMSHAFGLYKQLGETADQRQERTARDFSAAVFRCLGELRGKHNHELMWTMLLTDARRALIVRLLFSNYLKHAIGADSSAADGALAQCLSILTDFAASGVGRQLLLHLGWKRSSAAAQLAAVSPRWVVVPSLAEPLMTCLAALTRDFQPAAKIVDLCPLQATALLRFVENPEHLNSSLGKELAK